MNRNRNILAAAAYVTWIGFAAAFILGDKTDNVIRHHLNQALVINLAEIIGGVLAVIPLLGAILTLIVSIGAIILDIMGITSALNGSTVPLPYIGNIHLIG